LARWSVIAYDIACLIWLYCFWTSPKVQAPDPPAPLSPDALHEAKKWEETLKDFIARESADSLANQDAACSCCMES
jgi:hypothetical protein